MFIASHTPSYSEIARNTGVSVAHISRIYNGQRMPSFNVANLIATYLGLGLDEFYAQLREIKNRSSSDHQSGHRFPAP